VEATGLSAGDRPIVLFDVSGERFCIEVEFVREVVHMATLARPPVLPTIVDGFLNIAGTPIVVLRLDKILGLPKQTLAPYTSLIILRTTESMISLLVDQVVGIESVSPSAFLVLQANSTFNGCVEVDVQSSAGAAHLLSVDRLLLEKEQRAIVEFREIEARRLRELEERET
jgi:purine-binding chemotaxis protein CheW